ncbi:MAG: methyltransferase [Myxococcota bacterium]|nr:methyltransferase [Myxococcota bacterium]MEC9389903.1 methyltransferase [Myxococcota bacterium]
MTLTLLRPAPIEKASIRNVDASEEPRAVAQSLLAGNVRRLTTTYAAGVAVLDALNAAMKPPGKGSSYAARRAHSRRVRATALRLVAPVFEHRVLLEGAEPNGLLGDLYPDQHRFDLPFIEVQALHGANQRHIKGVPLAVLGHSVHPFYGTYAPARTTHLELFGTWLSQYAGRRAHAVDVGTGCGVLAFMLAKAGFERVTATDNNPNATESVRRELKRLPHASAVTPVCADLLEAAPGSPDLVVFNPPWTRGETDDILDQALCFQDGLFERFFDQAAAAMAPDGRVIIVFSNIIRLVQPDVPHPIDAELAGDRFRLVQRLQRKVKPTRGSDGSQRRTREKVEVWELALAAP